VAPGKILRSSTSISCATRGTWINWCVSIPTCWRRSPTPYEVSFGHVAGTAPRGTTLYLGNALAGRLLKSLLDLGVELRAGTAVRRLLSEGGRVTGVEVEWDGERLQLRA